jgi:hypothetical protein
LATNVEEIASRGNAKNWNCLVRECTPPSGTLGDLPNTRGWAAHERRMADVVYKDNVCPIPGRPRGRWFPSEHRPAIDISTLNAKRSLLLTRPAFVHHATDLEEYRSRVHDVFDAVSKGISKASVWKTFALADVTDTHVALDDSGCDCLKP